MTIIYEDDRKVWICDHCGHRMTQLSKNNKKLKLTTVPEFPAKRCACCRDDLFNPRSTMYKDKYFDKEYRKHIGGGFIPSLVEEESK